jgi:hypothetical protein
MYMHLEIWGFGYFTQLQRDNLWQIYFEVPPLWCLHKKNKKMMQ